MCLRRALFRAPKKELQKMQNSIQRGPSPFLYNTGSQGRRRSWAGSGPQLNIHKEAWTKTGRKGGFPAQVEVEEECKPGARVERSKQ